MRVVRAKYLLCFVPLILCCLVLSCSWSASAEQNKPNHKAKSLDERVAAVDGMFGSDMKEEEQAAILDQILAASLEEFNGDLPALIQHLLAKDDRIIARASMIAALLHQNKGRFGFKEIVETQDVLPRGDASKLIVQLTLRLRHEKMEQKTMTVPYLWSVFLPLTTDRHLIEQTVPHLNTSDPNLRKELHLVLDYKLRGTQWGSTFGEIGRMLQSQEGKIDGRLVQYMLLHDAEAGLMKLARYYLGHGEERTSLLLAYRTLDTAIWKKEHGLVKPLPIEEEERRALAMLCEHEQWWVRLYAAQLMEQQPKLRNGTLISRLKNDEHPLVRETLEGVRVD